MLLGLIQIHCSQGSPTEDLDTDQPVVQCYDKAPVAREQRPHAFVAERDESSRLVQVGAGDGETFG